ncbi:hypothetical protein GOV04_04980 [Candidatus Woesearchaeota archaeon]|nr:hypothetical protein [Candidatus Woesearchaeota archaeon]
MAKVYEEEVMFNEVFNLKDVYNVLYEWLEEKNYRDSKGDEKKVERLYLDRYKEDGNRELRILWKTYKQPDNKNFMYNINVFMRGLAIKDVELVKNGKKLVAQKGEITMIFQGNMFFGDELPGDEGEAFKKSKLFGQFKDALTKRTYKKTIEMHEDEVEADIHALIEEVKQHLRYPDVTPRATFAPKNQ